MAKKNRTPAVMCEDWLAAKAEEKEACARRVAIEEELIAALGFDKEEGSQTFNVEQFKCEMKSALNRKIDWKAYDLIEEKIPEALRPVKWKREVDATGVKFLRDNEPKVYAVLAKVLEVKPAKTGVTICRKE